MLHTYSFLYILGWKKSIKYAIIRMLEKNKELLKSEFMTIEYQLISF